jgi:hypothetical protein
MADLRALLAAYQSVREERDRERSRADNLYATILDWDRQ